MSIKLIESRLREYDCKSKREEINALKEIFQEIALFALSKTVFFDKAAFQGGTCLRILYGLPRFSEDLDFILQAPVSDFDWKEYSIVLNEEFQAFGLNLEVKDRSTASTAVKRAFLKENSFGKILTLQNGISRSEPQKIIIKLEIDTKPPASSIFIQQFVDFPFPYSVMTQDMPSLFASKCHALLCRPFIKGRDWFDFLWYVSRGEQINIEHLKSALFQMGPWKGEEIILDKQWMRKALEDKIMSLDWDLARSDVENLIRDDFRGSVLKWTEEMFLHYLYKCLEATFWKEK
ncbi:Uncharacterized protein SCG7109_AA_00070 [Chlamydiales bacterium SCGC AG-110-M15]|nr:Uncharacterized protein SCG7109_AA_00070 [Chlamydiales bacterium SCGC AG-110-M15]